MNGSSRDRPELDGLLRTMYVVSTSKGSAVTRAGKMPQVRLKDAEGGGTMTFSVQPEEL